MVRCEAHNLETVNACVGSIPTTARIHNQNLHVVYLGNANLINYLFNLFRIELWLIFIVLQI